MVARHSDVVVDVADTGADATQAVLHMIVRVVITPFVPSASAVVTWSSNGGVWPGVGGPTFSTGGSVHDALGRPRPDPCDRRPADAEQEAGERLRVHEQRVGRGSARRR